MASNKQRVNNFLMKIRPSPSIQPWMPAMQCIGRPYSDSLEYKRWEASNDQKILNLTLMRVIGFTFPAYLPERYHSMDCTALLNEGKYFKTQHLKRSAVNPLYNNNCDFFSTASQFFIFNKSYGTEFWNSIVVLHNSLKKQKPNYLQQSMSMLKFFHHDPTQQKPSGVRPHKLLQMAQVCKSAFEFLLNPWVLIQLPWHPVIYHQWLATVLAEVLLAKRELVEFHHWPIPKNLHHLVCDLFFILDTVYCRIVLGMRLITWQMKQCPKVNAKVVGAILDLVVLPSIPAIKFVVSVDYYDTVMALKNMAWPIEGRECKEGDDMAAQFQTKIDHSDTIYGLDFWGKEDLGDLFGATGDDIDTDIQKLKNLLSDIVPARFVPYHEFSSKETWDNEVVETWECHARKVINFAQESVKPWLRGEVDMDALPWGKAVFRYKFTYLCMQIEDAKDNFIGVIGPDVNIIYMLQDIQNQLFTEECLVCLVKMSYVAMKAQNKEVFFFPSNYEGPKMTVKEIEKTLEKLKTETFGRKLLEEGLPVACRVEVKADEKCPDLREGNEKVISIFELRIKKLVFNIYKKSSLGSAKTKSYPEWLVVQYLLPSFVAIIGEWPTGNGTEGGEGKRELATKENFVLFVHHIIGSYENTFLKQQKSSSSCVKFDVQGFLDPQVVRRVAFLNGQLTHDLQELNSSVYVLMNNEPNNKVANFTLTICTLQPILKSISDNSFLKSHPHVCGIWADEIYQFLSRLRFAMQKVHLASLSSTATRYQLLEAFLVLKELKKVAAMSCRGSTFELSIKSDYVFDLTERKIMNGKIEPRLDRSLDRVFTSEASKLSVQQLLGIILHFCVSSLKSSDGAVRAYYLKRQPTYLSELLKKVFGLILKEKWHDVKCLLTPLWCDKEHNDLSLVPYAVAKRFRHIYKEVLDHLKSTGDGKLGVNSVVPVKFCRSCKKFKCELMKCSICVDNSDFPDIHWFCGIDCEQKGLDEGHFNDHDYDLMVKCGLFDP